ncbi:MAG: NAD(P)/FAD-dependent oxidoreductase [Alphaproteobacteria bacterium]
MAEIYDLVVVGTGAAATTIAEKCRKAGWRVAIIDRRPYGGTCMLRGCDAKKLLWSVAATVDQARRFVGDGFAGTDAALSWPELIRFKRSFLKGAPEAVEGRLDRAGIDTLHGRAHFVDEHKIAVDGHTIEGRRIAIASGSRPAPLAIPDAERLLTSDDFLELDELPPSLVFVGGGYISFEFAHIAARGGAKVTVLHGDDRPLAQFDRDLVARLVDKSRRVGIDIRLDSPAEGVEACNGGVRVWARSQGANHPVEAAAAVHGAGRVPDIDDLDLAAGGVARDGHRLRLNACLQSISNPAVYAAGDAAAAGPMLTPVAALEADIVADNLLDAGRQRQPDYKGIPSVVFTIPPLAAVGMTEEEARSENRRFRVAQAETSGWYSARHLNEDTAAFKVLIEDETDRILGAHLLGPNAEEAINLFALAMRLHLSADQLRRVVPAYPSAGSDIGYMLG